MKPVYLTPGPSELYFTVQDHLRSAMTEKIGSISHRSDLFKSFYSEATGNLKELLSIPDEFAILFTSSATEIWERIIQNLQPEHATFFVNGSFSKKFHDFAENMGVEAMEIDSHGRSFQWDVEEIKSNTDLIAMAQNETSIGMAKPVEEISAIKHALPNATLAVDMVSGLPFYQPDFENWDCTYFSVQKGFGLPAGLGVWIIRKSLAQEVKGVAPHRQLIKMVKAGENNQTMETPNVLNLYLLAKVSGDMLRRGVDNIRIETNYKSALAYHSINDLPFLKPFIEVEKYRSKTTIVAECIDIKPQEIIDHLMKSGIQIGKGYGKYKDSHIRIANFPTHSKEIFELLVDKLKTI